MDAITLTVPTTMVTYLAMHMGFPWIKARWARKERFADVTPTDLPKSSKSSDARFRAVLIESAERIESLHEALGKKSDTGGFVILEMFKSLAANMTRQTEILGEQTVLLRQIAGAREKPDTRYRGPAA